MLGGSYYKGKFMQQHSYWISKIGKVNQKTKENLIYNLYIFFTFPSVTKQFCSMGMYWYNFQITAFSV